MYVIKHRIIFILSIICFALLIRNALLLRDVEPVGYVVDLYSMFPFTFYAGLISCYFISCLLVFNGKKMIGSLAFCINHLQILLIPYMLGYYSMGRADDMSYIGEYLQITNSGYFAEWDIYPASHIIGASISIVSDIQANLTSFIIPVIFSFLFIVVIYLFSREALPGHQTNSLIIPSSFILYLGVNNFSNAPHSLFFSFLPLYLFILVKYLNDSNNVALSYVIILMTLFMPFTHPFIVFFIIVLFIVHLILKMLSFHRFECPNISAMNLKIFIILIISFISWMLYNETLKGNLHKNYTAFLNKITIPVYFETAEKIAKVGFGFFDYIQLHSLYYGRYIFPTFFIAAALIVAYTNRHNFKANIFTNISYLILLYFICLLVQLILLFNPIISHQPSRIMNLNFVVYAQIPLFVISIHTLFFNKSKSPSRLFVICVILTLIWSCSLFGSFNSPHIYRINSALTYNEVEGMKWFYNVRDHEAVVSLPLSQISRFQDLLFGDKGIRIKDSVNMFPDHFGYSDDFTFDLAEINFESHTCFYVILLTIDELLYQETPGFVAVGRYNAADFDRLRSDLSIIKIYDTTNLEIFMSRKNTHVG